MRQKKNIIDLTNRYLQDLFEMAHANELKEHLTGNLPKRNDGYVFHYILPDAIMQSTYVTTVEEQELACPVGGAYGSLPVNMMKNYFNHNIQGFAKDLQFVIDNYKKQEKGGDYKLNKFSTDEKEVTEEDFNIDFFRDNTLPARIMVTKLKKTCKFTLNNNKSGKKTSVEVKYEDGVLQDIYILYDNTVVANIYMRMKYGAKSVEEIEYFEEGEITHLKYCADINSFFTTFEQVLIGIKETIEETGNDLTKNN